MVSVTSTQELRGLGLPASRGPGGLFESKRPEDVAWSDLLIALFTPLGARLMRRSAGSALHELLFDPIDPRDFSLVELAVRDAATRQVPHVVIANVAVLAREKGIELRIAFHLANDRGSDPTVRAVTIDKTFISPA